MEGDLTATSSLTFTCKLGHTCPRGVDKGRRQQGQMEEWPRKMGFQDRGIRGLGVWELWEGFLE